MADLKGYNADGETFALSTQANLRPGQFSRDRNLFPVSGSVTITPLTDLMVSHSKGPVLPKQQLKYVAVGKPGEAYSDDFYHRVRYLPKSPQSVGFVSSDITADFTVWYAYVYPGTLTSLTAANDEGLTVGGGIGTGGGYLALEFAAYSLGVSPDGPPDINATYYFDVLGVTSLLNILGTRITALCTMPRWTSPVTETIKFLSKAVINSDGSAQTFDVTAQPRRAINFQALLLGNQSTLYENLTWLSHPRPSAFPVGSDMTYLQGDLPAESLTLTLDGVADRNFFEGGNFFLGDPSRNELVEIDTIAGDVITLARPTTVTWPNRSWATPAAIGLMTPSTKMSRLTPKHQEVNIGFSVNPEGADANLPVAAAGLVFEGFEVYVKEPSWDLKGLQHGIASQTSVIDQGTGRIIYDPVRPHGDLTKSYDWLLIGRQEITDFRAFLGRTKGVSNPVMIPTWAHDFTVTTDIAALDGGITVSNNSQFLELVGVTPGRDTVVVHSRTHGFLPFRISSTQDNNDGTITLFFTTQFQNDVPVADVQMCCFAPISLMSNSTKFTWLSPDVAAASASFTSVNV